MGRCRLSSRPSGTAQAACGQRGRWWASLPRCSPPLPARAAARRQPSSHVSLSYTPQPYCIPLGPEVTSTRCQLDLLEMTKPGTKCGIQMTGLEWSWMNLLLYSCLLSSLLLQLLAHKPWRAALLIWSAVVHGQSCCRHPLWLFAFNLPLLCITPMCMKQFCLYHSGTATTYDASQAQLPRDHGLLSSHTVLSSPSGDTFSS